MVYNNFSKYDIDVENGKIYSFYTKRQMKMWEHDGYVRCSVRDDKGNFYCSFAKVVYCATNGITIDEFPKNQNGRRYDVDHIDGDRKNNKPYNLRLVSHGDNIRNPITRERHKKSCLGENNPHFGKHHSDEAREKIKKARSKKVEQIDIQTGEVVKSWESPMEASKHGYCRNSILLTIKGIYSHHKGYKWRYANN